MKSAGSEISATPIGMHEAWEPDAISTTRTVARPERTFDSSWIDSAPSKHSLCANAQMRPDRVPSAPDANLTSPSKHSTKEAGIRHVDRTVVHLSEHPT